MKLEVCIHFNVNHTHAYIHMYVLILKFALVFFTAMKLRVTDMINTVQDSHSVGNTTTASSCFSFLRVTLDSGKCYTTQLRYYCQNMLGTCINFDILQNKPSQFCRFKIYKVIIL